MFLMNLLTSFTVVAVVGHKIVINFCSIDKFANCGLNSSSFLNRQFRSAVNIVHCTRKWNSVSGGGEGPGDAEGHGGQLVSPGPGHGGGPGQQY